MSPLRPSGLTAAQEEIRDQLTDRLRSGRLNRRDMLRISSVFGLGIVAGPVLAACADDSATATGTSSGTPRKGGTLRVASGVPKAEPEPVSMYDGASIDVVQQVVEYLIWVENDGTLTPVLAEKWSASDDAKTWTFTLKQGVKFNDGSPFTAKDVVATFDRLTDPDSNSAALSAFEGLLAKGGTTSTDDFTVVFNLERAYADFPYVVSSSTYNAVILPASYDGSFIAKPVGTGPFMLTSYVPNQKAVYARNPQYHDVANVYLDGVEMTFMAEISPRTTALLGNSVDVVAGVTYADNQPLYSNENVTILTTVSSGTNMVQMRTDMAPWDDKRVRQALAYSLDREAILQALYNGGGTVANDHVFAPSYAQAVDLPQRSQDYDKAKQLLADAGHPEGFTATLTTWTDHSPLAQLVQQMAKPAGIDITLDVQSSQIYYGSGDSQPWLEVPLGITEWAARGTAAQLLDVAFAAGAAWNAAHWDDAEFTAKIHEFEATTDQATRETLAQELAETMYEETPQIIPHWWEQALATSTKVHGLAANPSSYLRLGSAWLDA